MISSGLVRLSVLVCVVALALPSAAEDDPVATGLKYGLEFSVGQLASMGYKINCKAKDLDYKSDDSWYCAAFAKLSKQDEAEYKERVMHHLTKIRAELENVKKGIAAIQEGQEQILAQNRQTLLRLDEIGPETTIGKELSHIRTVYAEQYVPLFSGEREFSAERLRAFANRIVFTDRIHDRLGIINDQLTVSQRSGQQPLLRAYATRAAEKVRAGAGIEPAYIYLESIVDGLLAEQRKGYLLYVWATETLQSDCEVAEAEGAPDAGARCKAFREFPHTAQEYRKTFEGHVEAQLAELNAGLEYQVLAASDTHARSANFLHPDGERLFRRADLFTAANLGRFGIRGRIISMGDAFDGQVSIGGVKRQPVGDANKVLAAGGRVDWWTSTAKSLTYDELHFSDRWKTFAYHVPDAKAGTYAIETHLPYRPQIRVQSVQVGKESVPFGSFTAIERAGGGYALLSGEYDNNIVKSIDTVVGDLSKGTDTLHFAPEKLQAGVIFTGDLVWNLKNAPKDQYIDATRSGYAVSRKKVRYPAGGEVTFRADFADTHPTTCPNGACAEIPHHGVLIRLMSLSKPAFSGRSAELKMRSAVLIDTSETGSNGFVWEKSNSTDSTFDDRLTAGKESTKIRLDGTGRSVIFGGSMKLNAQTSTTSNTRWHAYALTFLENAYVTE
jgi:hypothetical protein